MRRMKLAILALLGFSTACSTVRRNAPAPETEQTEAAREQTSPDEASAQTQSDGQTEAAPQPTENAEIECAPRIRVLYGTRPPVPISEEQRQRLDRSGETAGTENPDETAASDGAAGETPSK